jgi:hypothetical protein
MGKRLLGLCAALVAAGSLACSSGGSAGARPDTGGETSGEEDAITDGDRDVSVVGDAEGPDDVSVVGDADATDGGRDVSVIGDADATDGGRDVSVIGDADATDGGRDIAVIPDADAAERTDDDTVGDLCDPANDECDTTGKGQAVCFPLGKRPACIMRSAQGSTESPCRPAQNANEPIPFCDNGRGLCLRASATNPLAGVCVPRCLAVRATGEWEIQCKGGNSCAPAQVLGDTGNERLSGICQGGCTADAECSAGGFPLYCNPISTECDVECDRPGVTCSGGRACVGKKCAPFQKNPGDACNSDTECDCLFGQTEAGPRPGYCSKSCQVGGSGPTGCPSGLVCDGQLTLTTGADFWTTKVPAGMGGTCKKTCTTLADCPTGFVCEASLGLTRKVCNPPRPSGGDGGS